MQIINWLPFMLCCCPFSVNHYAPAPQERREVSRRIEEGAVDLVIGTQALLRQEWGRLGLVVIDEQHK